MSAYKVFVYCAHCGLPHSVNVRLDLPEQGLENYRIVDVFADRPLPQEVAFMQSNKYRCPHTKRFFSTRDIEKAVLFADS